MIDFDSADYEWLDENSHAGVKLLYRLMVNSGMDDENALATFSLLHAAGFRITVAYEDDDEDEAPEDVPVAPSSGFHKA